MVEEISKRDLQESLRAITSLISKCEKAQLKLTEGSSQHSLLRNRIKALRVSSTLITKELRQHDEHDRQVPANE
ncbi:hypothetical protein [Paenibacillus sp. 1P07SE]|uniref:hypothetical protein n=1 Tax=Paenibacillus sp. 1P07SE TaxID=3132209 RepID=UPI0039A77294